jgi:hypothetical protein
MSSETHDPELAALAKALAALAPAAGRLDRDQILFRGGQASIKGRRWLWPGVAALLALVAGAEGLSKVLRPAPQRVQCVVYQRIVPPASPVEQFAGQRAAPWNASSPASQEIEPRDAALSYLRLQRLVLARGVDALPNPRAAASDGELGPLRGALPKNLSLNDWMGRQSP